MNRPFKLLLALATCLWIGCGEQSKTVSTPGGSKPSVSQKGSDSEVTGTGGKGNTSQAVGSVSTTTLPEGFPTDIPIYPGAKLTASAKTPEMMTAIQATSDPVKKVVDFYTEKLKGGGWDIQTTSSVAEGGMAIANKGKLNCSVNVARNGEQSTVSIAVSTKKD
jgi:hypothetical protein